MDVDLDGDGIVERLVALESVTDGRQGQMWTVFDKQGERFRPLGGVSLSMPGSGFLTEEFEGIAPGFYAYYPSGTSQGALVSFHVVGGEVTTEVVHKFEFDNDLDPTLELFKNSNPPKAFRTWPYLLGAEILLTCAIAWSVRKRRAT